MRWLLAIGLLWPSQVSADLLLLGDYTPIYALTPLPPHKVVKGNQDLFLRFGGDSEVPSVAIRFGNPVYSAHTIAELVYFYGEHNYRVENNDSLELEELSSGVNLLILGNPDWAWSSAGIEVISELLARGGNVVLAVEPGMCAVACRGSSNQLLEALGSSLRIDPDSESCCGGRQWGMLADQPFMSGIGPVTYGATFSIKGGTALIYNKEGSSMLSIDHPSRPVQEHADITDS